MLIRHDSALSTVKSHVNRNVLIFFFFCSDLSKRKDTHSFVMSITTEQLFFTELVLDML